MPPQRTYNEVTNNLHHQLINRIYTKDDREIGSCEVSEIGLEKFIKTIVKEIDIHIGDSASFNLNERAMMYSWKDVFDVEAVYSKCLGISKRLYKCDAFVHEPDQSRAYIVVEEFNQRMYSFLPEFSCHILVFVWYDKQTMAVTKVNVQYDQESFFLYCLGFERYWRWFVGNILTPPARLWAKAYLSTGLVNPIT